MNLNILPHNNIMSRIKSARSSSCLIVPDNKITTLTEPFKNKTKIVERDNIDIPNTHIYYRSLSRLSTNTSIDSGGVKLIIADSSCEMLIICFNI